MDTIDPERANRALESVVKAVQEMAEVIHKTMPVIVAALTVETLKELEHPEPHMFNDPEWLN